MFRFLVATIVLFAVISCEGTDDPSSRDSNGEPALFADASGGIQQFVVGETMEAGTYDFDCENIGNVSVQLGKSPYTVSLESGDQTRTVASEDLVTVAYCKIYGPE